MVLKHCVAKVVGRGSVLLRSIGGRDATLCGVDQC